MYDPMHGEIVVPRSQRELDSVEVQITVTSSDAYNTAAEPPTVSESFPNSDEAGLNQDIAHPPQENLVHTEPTAYPPAESPDYPLAQPTSDTGGGDSVVSAKLGSHSLDIN